MDESKLKLLLENGEYPFVYLYFDKVVDEDIEHVEDLLKVCHEYNNNTKLNYNFFIEGLSKFPARYLIYLTFKLNRRIGSDGDRYKIHDYIDEIIGEELSIKDREKLWEMYRNALLSLGLSVNNIKSDRYIVDEYSRQMGIPLTYIDSLTEHLLRQWKVIGCPDKEDLTEIIRWKNDLCERSGMQKFMKSVLKQDEHNIYINSFIKLIENIEAEKKYKFEYSMADLLNKEGSHKSISYVAPKVLYQNGNVGLMLPEGCQWEIVSIDGGCYSSLEGTEYLGFNNQFIPFDDIIYSMVVRNSKGNLWKLDIWRKGEASLLFFSERSGEFKYSRLYGESKDIFIEPGNYISLSNKKFDESWLEENPYLEIYAKNISLTPGGSVQFSDGNTRLVLSAEEKPYINFNVEPYKDANSFSFYMSHELSLKAFIPNLLEEQKQELSLRVSHVNSDQYLINEADYEEGLFVFNLNNALLHFDPGLYRFRFEIIYKNKVQTKINEYVWNGLLSIDKAIFSFERKPSNLINRYNAILDDVLQRIQIQDVLRHDMVLEFAVNEDVKQIKWFKSGVTLYIDHHNVVSEEIPIQLGKQQAVVESSRTQLIIYSDSDLEVSLGDYNKIFKFNKTVKHAIYLSVLMEYARNDSVLWAKNLTTNQIIKLLELNALHNVANISKSATPEFLSIQYNFLAKPEKIIFVFEDMLYGALVKSDEYILHKEGITNITLMNGVRVMVNIDTNTMDLMFDSLGWRDGWWFIDVEIMINGIWGRPTNDRKDYYSLLQVVYNQGFCEKAPSDTFFNFSLNEKMACFERIHQRLRNCYSLESWGYISWINEFWYGLAKELSKIDEPRNIEKLIRLSLEDPDEKSSESWIPLVHLGASRPKIYSYPTANYQSFMNKTNSNIDAIISNFHLASDIISLISNGKALTVVSLFDHYFKYANGKSTSPGKLNVTKLNSALESCLGDKLLGMDVYKSALLEMKHNYDRSASGYEDTRGKSLSMCRNINNMSKVYRFAAKLPVAFTDIFEAGIQTEQYYENLDSFNSFLSIYALNCRLELRKSNTLKNFMQGSTYVLKDFIKYVAFILGIGQTIFWYYLMVWEIILNIVPNLEEAINEQSF